MADISKIQIQSGLYDIKDKVARNTLNEIIGIDEIIIISDSYGTNYGGLQTNFITMVKNYLPNVTIYSSAENSAGFSVPGDHGNTFLNLIQKLNIPDKSKIKKIYVVGCLNDINSSEVNFKQYVNQFYTYVKANFPNAKNFIVDCGVNNKTTDNNIVSNIIKNRMILSTYSEIATSLIKGHCLVANNDLLQSDGIHPNTNGATNIAKFITQHILNDDSSFSYTWAGLLNNYKSSIIKSIETNNGYIVMFTDGINTSFGFDLYHDFVVAQQNFRIGQNVDLFINLPFNGTRSDYKWEPFPVVFIDNTGKLVLDNCVFKFNQNKITMQIMSDHNNIVKLGINNIMFNLQNLTLV